MRTKLLPRYLLILVLLFRISGFQSWGLFYACMLITYTGMVIASELGTTTKDSAKWVISAIIECWFYVIVMKMLRVTFRRLTSTENLFPFDDELSFVVILSLGLIVGLFDFMAYERRMNPPAVDATNNTQPVAK